MLSFITYELKFKKKWSIEMRKFNSEIRYAEVSNKIGN